MSTAILIETTLSVQPRLQSPLRALHLRDALAGHQNHKGGQSDQDGSEG